MNFAPSHEETRHAIEMGNLMRFYVEQNKNDRDKMLSRFSTLSKKWRKEAKNIGNMEDWLRQIISNNLISNADELDAIIAELRKGK